MSCVCIRHGTTPAASRLLQAHTHTHTHIHTHTHTHTHARTCTHTLTHALSLSHTHTRTHASRLLFRRIKGLASFDAPRYLWFLKIALNLRTKDMYLFQSPSYFCRLAISAHQITLKTLHHLMRRDMYLFRSPTYFYRLCGGYD